MSCCGVIVLCDCVVQHSNEYVSTFLILLGEFSASTLINVITGQVFRLEVSTRYNLTYNITIMLQIDY